MRVEFVMSDRYLDLLKGEADVAFRSGDTDDELIGRKIADSVWAVYASRDYIARHGQPQRMEDLSRPRLVSFEESLSGHRVVKWLKEVAPDAKIAARNKELARSWRLLTHPDLRRTPRIAAFFDFVIAERESLKSILTG